jgi:cytochrome c-type protein NapC
MKLWLQQLFRPSATRSVFALVAIGALLGLVGMITFDYSLHATSTESFCTSCHEMEVNPYAQLKKTSHYNNAAGVRPTCSDCHVPKEFVPKMIRKIEAAREVWGTIIGKINTPEKYIAHTPIMKAREIARLKANDSQECRNCHEVERMLMELQSAKAQKYHQAVANKGKTCIDCHAGIAHPENSGNVSAHGF